MTANDDKNRLYSLSELAPRVGCSYMQLWKWATQGVEGVTLEVKEIYRMESSVGAFERFRDAVTEAKRQKRAKTRLDDARPAAKRSSAAERELQSRGY